jgi:hypothetical protein
MAPMTDRLTALVALKEAVEAGSARNAHFLAVWPYETGGWQRTDWGFRASVGSVDAALSLREAVLPGWDWQAAGVRGRASAMLWLSGDTKTVGAGNPDPARALLLAIIAALIEEERNAG